MKKSDSILASGAAKGTVLYVYFEIAADSKIKRRTKIMGLI
jgi:hypothetical protein